ncbi:MAG TPA: class I SAM-dependent methyltransferase [Gemmatimonadaceae bacterium]|nr:class I SAM-dependent methyltransferase [Gemmatimonadaceae bacterium]
MSARRLSEWWETHFDAYYLLEYSPMFDAARDRREVGRLLDLLALPVGSRVLDVPCGQGRHAHLLAEAGLDVTGLDYSAYLLKVAKRRGKSRGLRYERGDMRTLPAKWTGRFDAVVNLFTSFGFFLDPSDDVQVIREFARVLAPGGTLIWHGGSRDGVMARFLESDWWKASDGTMVGHKRAFDPVAGVMTVRASWSGKKSSGEREHRIRLYTATRLAELFAAAGMVVYETFDGWNERALSRTSSEMLLVARKEDDA